MGEVPKCYRGAVEPGSHTSPNRFTVGETSPDSVAFRNLGAGGVSSSSRVWGGNRPSGCYATGEGGTIIERDGGASKETQSGDAEF